MTTSEHHVRFPLLSLQEAALHYGSTIALEPCSLEFTAAEEVVIVGHSGSGKSSLLKLASGLVNATAGRITAESGCITDMSEHQRSAFRANHVGFVYQDYNLIEHLTVFENVEMAWWLRQRRTTPQEAIEAVGLGHRLTHRPGELSGGEQQRVSIARAICGGPSVLFADEPTGALDDDTTDTVIETLRQLRNDFGLLLIVVTHDRNLAESFERKISLHSGHVISDERIN